MLIHGMGIFGGKFSIFPKRITRICQRKPAGIISANVFPEVGTAVETVAGRGKAPVPAMGISHEDGIELRAFARRHSAMVEIEADGDTYDAECVNLVGEMGLAGDETIGLSCHLDTHAGTLGSFDNLAGLVTLIEIVRALAPFQDKFKRRLLLISFTGEEFFFLGSKSYVNRHETELDQLKFVFNMDGLIPSTAERVAVMWSPAMRDRIDFHLRQPQCRVEVRNHFCMSSNYLPFMLKGVAAARPADWKDSFPLWSHTKLDTPAKVPVEWIRLNAMPFAQLMVRLLMDPDPLPRSRKSPEEVRYLIAEDAVAEDIYHCGFDV